MKICFLMGTPFTLGGEQRVVSVISNILLKDYDVSIICTNPNISINYDLYDLNRKVKIFHTKKCNNIFVKIHNKFKIALNKINMKTGIFKNNLFILKYIKRYSYLNKQIIKIINENKFDYVIGVASDYSLILSMIKNKVNSKLIGWQHNCFDAYFRTKGRRLYKQDILSKYMIKTLDKYIVLTNNDKEKILSEYGIEVESIYNPLSFISKEVSINNNKVFFAAGRLEHVKGFDMLIDAFRLFAEKNNEWKLVIVGDGSERENIIKRINEYNLQDRIRVDHTTDNIKSYLINSSVYLMTSRWEGFGLVVTEAFEMGVPVISFDLPALKELINDGKSGILIPKFDIEKFANAMYELAINDELRKKMGDEAKKRAGLFSHERIGGEWKNIFNVLKGEQ